MMSFQPRRGGAFRIGSALLSAAALSASLFVAGVADAQVKWRNGPVELPQHLAKAALQNRLDAFAQNDEASRVLLHFDSPVEKATRAELADAGVRLLEYVGENAWFASLDKAALDTGKAAAARGLVSIEEINPDWKLHPDLADGIIQPWSIVGRDLVPQFEGDKVPAGERPDFEFEARIAVYVNFHKDVNLDTEGARIIREIGGEIRSLVRSTNMIVAHISASTVRDLSNEDAVLYVEPPLPLLTPLNAENRALTEADVVQAAPYGLSGLGVDVLVYDGGQVRASHLGYTNPPIIGPSDTSGVSDHATHVAGTVGAGDTGAPGIDPTEKGMAPNVQIISYGFEQPGGLQQGFLYTDPGDIEADYLEAIGLGADVSNNSIGTNTAPNGFPCDWEGNYNNTSILIDSIVRGSLGSPFRVFWANGNERQGSQRCGATYQTTAPPACAKNHITVGSLDSDTDLNSSFTSWGPADDGRMKPDLSAPGCQVGGDGGVRSLGSGSDTDYGVKCGTSMASPTACGIGALLIEDWRTIFPSEPDPRNSTLKALLAHTAQDIEDPGPDYKTGYGSIRAAAAVDQLRSGNLLEDSVDQSTSFLATVIVQPGDPELKITMAWDDAPATPLADPVLVNDLDLVVFSPSGARAYPWTLGGLANPSAPAERTQENHVDNIEQVLVENPEAGAWFVEVRGTNVPTGPQPFSLVASPFLVNCADAGTVNLNGTKFACSDTVNITVIDCGLNTSDSVLDSVDVTADSGSEPGGETITLLETDPASAKFTGSIDIDAADSAGVLLVADGDTVTVTYNDADDGTGSPAVVTANASVDCTPPVVSGVTVTDVQPRDATIEFTTDEPATAMIHYGTSCGTLGSTEVKLGANTSHSILLTGLTDDTGYFFSVEVADEAGNTATDDNAGSCYTFTTPEVPDFFTEQFTAGGDLQGTALFLAPSGGVDQYVACSFPIGGFPTDPAGGTPVSLGDDDSFLATLSGGNQVSMYGASYNSFYIGSNGYLTFGVSDTDYTEDLIDHFDAPRVSALFDDLNPTLGGSVSWKEESNRAVVTYEDISQYSDTDSNSVQVELFFDGSIQISWVNVETGDFIAGISEGAGLDPDFFASDLSVYGSCGPRPPFATSASYTVPEETPYDITLLASDDGLPDPPGALTYTITSLPTQELRDKGDDSLISSVPYTLLGNEVTYTPGAGFSGSDSFGFSVSDGGTPPDGGDSDPATVSLFVEPVLALPFYDDFPSPTQSFDPLKWSLVDDATVDDFALGEPSEPYSARFNGMPDGGDTIESLLMNTAAYTDLTLTFWYQRTGPGNSPESGEDLVVEFVNDMGQWEELARYPGDGPDMTTFTEESIAMPSNAYHSAFRLRFSSTGTSSSVDEYDDWFVDEVLLDGTLVACDGDADGDGTVTVNDVSYVIFRFGNSGAPGGGVDGDANGDGIVDVNDVSFVIFRFGPCP